MGTQVEVGNMVVAKRMARAVEGVRQPVVHVFASEEEWNRVKNMFSSNVEDWMPGDTPARVVARWEEEGCHVRWFVSPFMLPSQ